MGIGAITIPDAGSVTEPADRMRFDLPTQDTLRCFDGLPLSIANIPGERGLVFGNGVDQIRHLIGGGFYRTSILAPPTKMTVATAGSQATATLDISSYSPANGDEINVTSTADKVQFVTALSGSPQAHHEVLLGGSDSATLDNLKDLGDALNTFDPNNGTTFLFRSGATNFNIPSRLALVTTKTATTVIWTSIIFGTGGNLYVANLETGTWGSGSTFGSTAGTVGTTGFFAGGTNAGGTAPEGGARRLAFAHYRDGDGAMSGISPTADIETSSDQNLALSAMTQSAIDADTTHVRWFSTTKGGDLFYPGKDVARAATADTDDLSDATLTGKGQRPYDEGIHRSYESGYAPKAKWFAYYDGSVWAAGAEKSADYAAGTATFAASDTITIANGYPTERMVGRFIKQTGVDENEEYLILDVNEATGAITINKTYEGATGSGLFYKIMDKRDPYELFRCEPGFINTWPIGVRGSLKGPTGPSATGITGLISMWESLIVFTADGVWRVTAGNPIPRIRQVLFGTGCVNGNTIKAIDGFLYWLGGDGIYKWDGGPEALRISNPPVERGIARGIQGTIDRINYAHHRWFHANYSPDDDVYRVFVALDKAVSPSHAIVYDLQTGAFPGLDRVDGVTATGEIATATCPCATLAGKDDGTLFQYDISNSDGAYGFEPVQAVSSGTSTSVTCASVFPTTGEGLAGVPCLLEDGAGTFYEARVASNTATALNFRQKLGATPTSAWTVIVGAIFMNGETGRFNLGVSDEPTQVDNLIVTHVPDADGTYYMAVAKDQDSLLLPEAGPQSGDLTRATARTVHSMNKGGFAKKFAWYAFEPGCDPTFSKFELGAWARGRAKAGA